MNKYRVKQTYKAQNVSITDKSYRNSFPRFATFEPGTEITGMQYMPADKEISLRFAPSILVNNTYIVPLSVVETVESGSIYSSDGTKDKPSEILFEQQKITGKGYKVGLIVGALTGSATAMLFRWSVWKFAIAGALIGGYMGYRVSEAKAEVITFKPIS